MSSFEHKVFHFNFSDMNSSVKEYFKMLDKYRASPSGARRFIIDGMADSSFRKTLRTSAAKRKKTQTHIICNETSIFNSKHSTLNQSIVLILNLPINVAHM